MRNNQVTYVLSGVLLSLWCCGNAVLLLLSPLYLQIIYSTSIISTDPYGLSRREQSAQALLTLTSLYPGINQEYTLSNLGMTSREIKHMIDVKNILKLFLVTYGLIFSGVGYLVSQEIKSIQKLQQLVRHSLFATTGILSCVAILIFWFWDTLFTVFHMALFQPGTWQFSESDLLIRLFPEQFWFVSALTVLALMVFQLIGVYVFSHIAKIIFGNFFSKSK